MKGKRAPLAISLFVALVVGLGWLLLAEAPLAAQPGRRGPPPGQGGGLPTPQMELARTTGQLDLTEAQQAAGTAPDGGPNR